MAWPWQRRNTSIHLEINREDEDEDDIDLTATCNGRQIGYLRTSRNRDRLRIDDFHVNEDHRRHGIGHELLVRLLSEAKHGGIQEVWGSIVDRDLSESPFLLDFYQRHNFELREPDAECLPHATKKIVYRFNSAVLG